MEVSTCFRGHRTRWWWSYCNQLSASLNY